MQRDRRTLVACGLLVLTSLALASPALASSGGGGLPWEAPLQQIQQSITGPVAGFIALAAVAIAGGMLIFGGELNDFARRLCYIALVGGVLLGATQIVGLFGATGATIGEERPGAETVDRGTIVEPSSDRGGDS
ncbi:conjugal transfer protein TrbC [Mesorhizobium sp. M2E.F.Ca.ET.209.01.1.1]|uniref:TrbC/VirB2 family protein n=1 Tax=Mesorhizobium sp. M2E.F.Ca.ET.209.01.1.1 TaxID=2500526 RepID=UPI000FDB5C1C|nr:TrbC/VirB2 family protein [Mesorhizobium sp. M2E.F.Ca.ET.209.01.1.1]TGS14433.1 conjugal transfer protein TrbC [Mesorhizobium sp. M2E.F.Ca.ET.209.01.1.1]